MTRFLYIIFYGFARLLSLLPLRMLYGFSDGMYVLVFHVVGYRKKVVYENLRNAFPEKTDKERDLIARKFYHHLCDIMVEIIKMLHISNEEIKRRMVFSNN